MCYACSTTGNTTADACYAGTSSNPIMSPIQCANGVSYCFRETTSKFDDLLLFLLLSYLKIYILARNSITTTSRGCRGSTCSSNGCVTCATNYCNTMKGSANFSAGGFSFAGFMMLVVIGVYKSF